jgi:PAS domain S-box-containing protein
VALFSDRDTDRILDRLEVTTATTVQAGLETLESESVDCIISDYDMGTTTGVDFLETVRAPDPELPFILFTGKGSEAVAGEAISAGVTDYLQKATGTEVYTLLAKRIVEAVMKQRATANYREVFEKINDGILIHDSETGDVLDANQRYCEMLGYDREAVVGMTVEDFNIDDERYSAAEGRRRIRMAASGDSQVFGWVVETNEGDRLPVEVHLKRTTIDTRDCVLAVVSPVSMGPERSPGQQHGRVDLSGLFTHLEDPVALVTVGDDDAVVETTNAAFEDRFGVADVDAVGELISDVLPVADSVAVANWVSAADWPDQPAMGEIRLATPAGTQTTPVRLIPTNDADDRAYLTFSGGSREAGSPHRDKQNRELLEALVNTLPNYIFIQNAAGEYLEAIVGIRQGTTGYTATDLIGQSVDEFLPAETADRIMAAISAALETGELQTIEYDIEGSNGDSWYEASVMPLPEGYEGDPAVIVAAHNITERKVQTQKLERKTERLEEFASIVSHDLRNPLNVAQGRLSMARADHESDHLVAVERSLDRMEALIADLLTLARSGQAVTDLEVVSVSAAAEAALRNVVIDGQQVRIETDQRIRADRSRLHQLFENLFRNAVEHCGADVCITVGELSDSEGFFIADDGPGIPPEPAVTRVRKWIHNSRRRDRVRPRDRR